MEEYIVITKGGWGTYPENIGRVCEVISWRGDRAIISSKGLHNEGISDEFSLHQNSFRWALPEEIPNYEPNYEIY